MNTAWCTDFLTAVLNPSGHAPWFAHDPDSQARFSVYRHTGRAALIAALRGAYPTVVVALGDAYFDALAAEFIHQNPPRSPVLQEYSPGFARFMADFAPLADWPWLADVARIDWARREVYHAQDAEPLAPDLLRELPVAQLLDTPLQLHPALRVLDSIHPIGSLWQSLHQGEPPPAVTDWAPQSVQVWRVGSVPQVAALSRGAAVLRQSLSAGQRLGDALEQAAWHDPQFQAASEFAALLGNGLIVAPIANIH